MYSVKHLIIYVSLFGALFFFNNCTGAFESVPYYSSSSFSSNVFLNGSGVSSPYGSGCIPTIYTDFIDKFTWNARHLEPRDCAIVNVSTPVFSWRQPSDRDLAVPWTFTLRTDAGILVASRTSQSPRILLAETPLTPGNYTWKVTYQNNSSVTIESSTRRFTVSTKSVGITIPDSETIFKLASQKPHPRALPTGSTFKEISAAALGGEYNSAFNAYMKSAATYRLEVPPAPPADLTRADFKSDIDYNTWKSELSNIARKENAAIETLGYATFFSGDISYAVAGVTRLLNLAAWPTRGATGEENHDGANREIYVALALGLDLYAGRLTSTQTSTVVMALKDRIQQFIVKLPPLDTSPYQSHPLNGMKFLVTALLYAVGTPEFPEADAWLRQAWDVWSTVATTWGADGGFADSTAYSWWCGISLAEIGATVRLITNIDLSKWAAINQFGNNMMALVAPSINLPSPFGDSAETNWLYQANSSNTLRLYAAVTRSPAHEWYWRVTSTNINKPEALITLHYLILGLKQPPVTPVAPIANSWIFEDEGQVAIHSRTADPLRSSLFFRSSRLGSFNHATADNNGFVFVSKGQPLFISGGYYPYFKSPHHSLVGRATRYKNALTFDGGIGQAEPTGTPTSPGAPLHSMDARGKLLNFYDNGTWAITTGDATLAYRGYDPMVHTWTPLLSNAVRTVAYNRTEKVAVIYDWATSSTPRSWELNFQMINEPSINTATLRATSGMAQGCANVYNLAGAFKVTKGFPIAPENGLPDQYQARYTASRPSSELLAVTVIREDCRSLPVSVSVNGTIASISINGGSPLIADRETVTVP